MKECGEAAEGEEDHVSTNTLRTEVQNETAT